MESNIKLVIQKGCIHSLQTVSLGLMSAKPLLAIENRVSAGFLSSNFGQLRLRSSKYKPNNESNKVLLPAKGLPLITIRENIGFGKSECELQYLVCDVPVSHRWLNIDIESL